MSPPSSSSNPVIPAVDKTTTEAQTSTSTRRVAQLTGHLAPAAETEKVNVRPQLPIDYPVSRLELDSSHCIDHVRPLKVAVIGAGLSGINAGILLPAKVPGIQLTIFEKNSDVVSTESWIFWAHLLTSYRVAHGSKTSIRECDVIYLPMYIKAHSLPILNGQKYLPKAPRFAITGSHVPGSMMSTSTSNWATVWMKPNGTTHNHYGT